MQKLLPTKTRVGSDVSLDGGGSGSESVSFDNPRKASSGRRLSRVFRRAPVIVIHPPEENVTNSLPDINAACFIDAIEPSSDLNYSCPDFKELSGDKKMSLLLDSSLDSSAESFESCYSLEESTLASKRESFKRQTSLPLDLKRSKTLLANIEESTETDCTSSKVFDKKPKPAPEISDLTPGEYLKLKLKQSLSMHNIFAAPPSEAEYYHTVHGGDDISRFAFGDRRRSTVVDNSRVRLKIAGAGTSQHGSKTVPQRFVNRRDDAKSVDDGGEGARARLCCGRRGGGAGAGAVVPIAEYLESYYTRTVRYTTCSFS